MEEQEWLTTTDDRAMLRFLGSRHSVRKMRLFLVGCARSIWDEIPVDWWKEAMLIVEAYADGGCDGEAIHQQTRRFEGLYRHDTNDPDYLAVTQSAREMFDDPTGPVMSKFMICLTAARSDRAMHMLGRMTAPTGGRHRVSNAVPLLRDVIGNPFRPVAFNPSWRTEHSVGLASRMYEEREFAAMPILADALQEAGCENADILAHCREPGTHVRGCWVVDLVLGKE